MILFKATLGNTTFDHPELLSFQTGFRLDCRNRWNILHVCSSFLSFPYWLLLTTYQGIRNFQGGPETFMSLVSTSYISSADVLLPHVEFVAPTNANVHVAALRAHTGDITLTFEMLVERFFRGTGTPCPLRFAGARGGFHPIIDLSRIDDPGFRSQMFVWAATGSPFIDPTEGGIHVSLSLASNILY